MHPALRRQGAGLRLELLQRVREWQRKVQVVAWIVVHGPVQHVCHAERQSAAQRVGLPAVAAAHHAACKDLHLRHRRRQILQEVCRVPPVQRQVEDAPVVHHLADAEVSRFDHLRVRLNGDRFGHRAERQRDGNDLAAVDLQHDTRLHGGPEALQHHFELIGADRYGGKREQAVRIGDDLALEPGLGLDGADGRPGKDAST